jgi:malonyl-CoA/methylmalonyl-CoA synthetase
MEHSSLSAHFSASFLKHTLEPAITFYRHGKLETRLTYLELETYSNRMANRFRSMGVVKGDRVILFFQKSIIWVIVHLALQKMGAVSVPLNPGFKEFEMAYLLKDAQAKIIVLESDQADFINAIDPQIVQLSLSSQEPFHNLEILKDAPDQFSSAFAGDPVYMRGGMLSTSASARFRSSSRADDRAEASGVGGSCNGDHGFTRGAPLANIHENDPGVMIYTSGTTGKPKGVILTQKNLISDALNIIDVWQINECDTLCHALPLFHVHGLCFALHTALIAGAQVVMLDRFSPQTVVEILSQREGDPVCSVFMAVPAMYVKLIEHMGEQQTDFRHLRLLTSGSAPLLPKDFDGIYKVFGKEPVEREGMSETGMNF